MKSIINISLSLGLTFILSFPIFAQSIDLELARQYFNEAQTLAEKDQGKLWGINLYGPLVFVDTETRQGVANSPVPVDGWTEKDGIFTGTMPKKMGFANTAIDWEGQGWSMIVYDQLSDDPFARGSLMIHELWHQHEDKLGIIGPYDQARHLDKKYGRTLLFLEWNALLNACKTSGKSRKIAIQDALTFREMRAQRFEEGIPHERAKELHEGMAEYTGMTLCGLTDSGKINYLTEKVLARDAVNTLVWTYAYIAGPLYGYLLDQKKPGWTHQLDKKTDLGELLAHAYEVNIQATAMDALESLGAPYGYDSIMPVEEERVAKSDALQATFKKRFQEEPVLFLPNQSLRIQFNPQHITPFEGVGTVYGTLSGQSKWGEVKVSNSGILLLQGWKGLVLDVGSDWDPAQGLKTDQYEIILEEGYEIIPTEDGWTVQNFNKVLEQASLPEILEKSLSKLHPVFQLSDEEIESIWPGYNLKKMKMAFWSSEFTCLINYPEAPEGFEKLQIQLGEHSLYFSPSRPSMEFMNKAWNPDDICYMLGVADWETNWFYELLFHEGFHTFQIIDDQLKDQQENPAVQPFFPIADLRFYSLGFLEQKILESLLGVTDQDQLKAGLADYFKVVDERHKKLHPLLKEYELKSDVHEGLATYVGYKGVELMGIDGYTLKNLPLRAKKIRINPGDWRNRAYSIGSIVAFSLAVLYPDWKNQISSDQNLADIGRKLLIDTPNPSISSIKKKYNYKSLKKDLHQSLDEDAAKNKDLENGFSTPHLEIILPTIWERISMSFNPLAITRVGKNTVIHKNGVTIWQEDDLKIDIDSDPVLAEVGDFDIFSVKKLRIQLPEDYKISTEEGAPITNELEQLVKNLRITAPGISVQIASGKLTSSKGGLIVVVKGSE